MKVFISWSKQPSNQLAEILRGWIPAVIQRAKPFYSSDDMRKGTRWGQEIAKELQDTQVGLICLTPNNLLAPWVMFEAGALSKQLAHSRVCPILFGVTPAGLEGPLAQFQAAPFDRAEMHRVVRMINETLREDALDSQVLDRVFEMWWPKLEADVGQVLQAQPREQAPPPRADRELLEEVLMLIRQFPSPPLRSVPVEHLMNLLREFSNIVCFCALCGGLESLYPTLTTMAKSLDVYVKAYGEGLASPSLRGDLRAAVAILNNYRPHKPIALDNSPP